MKKFLALVLTLIMALSLATVAFADPATTPATSISSPDNGHTYYAYQIFTGDFADSVLSNIKWGNGITTEGQTEVQEYYDTHFPIGNDVAHTAGSIAKLLKDTRDAEAFAKLVAPHLTNKIDLTKGEYHPKDTAMDVPHYMTVVDPGYYLVKDGLKVTGHDAATDYILHVVGSVALNPKASVPNVDKMQSTTYDSGYTHDVVDVNINDMVYYELTGTMPNTLDDYKTYKYVFHDTLSEGLTAYKDSVEVFIDGIEVTGYIVTYSDNELTVSFADILKAVKADASDTRVLKITSESNVVVRYKAKLNADAVIGNPGNPNKVKLEFSNDPTWVGNGTDQPPTGETPEVVVVAFTFQINVDKQDEANKELHLADAEFVLWNQDKTKVVKLDNDGKVTGWAEHYKGDAHSSHEASDEFGTVVKSGADGKFNFIGLDAGDYFLEEIKAPAGYHKLDAPVAIKIIPTYEQNKLTGLRADVGKVQVKGDTVDNGDDTEYTGAVSIAVRNAKGETLPSTGGIGTTIFYVVGAVLMVGAAVLLVTKKRMNAM